MAAEMISIFFCKTINRKHEKNGLSRSFRLPSEPSPGGITTSVEVKVRIGLSW